jgi:hypothetical protein
LGSTAAAKRVRVTPSAISPVMDDNRVRKSA